MLGIVIGISSVIMTVGLGQGAQDEVASQIDALGSNLLIISPGSSTGSDGVRGGFGSASTLTLADADAIGRQVGRARCRQGCSDDLGLGDPHGRQHELDDQRRGHHPRLGRRALADAGCRAVLRPGRGRVAERTWSCLASETAAELFSRGSNPVGQQVMVAGAA